MQIDSKLKKKLESWWVLMCPTDTCYWFSAFYDCKQAIANIQEVKKRFWEKPFSLLFSSLDQAKWYCEISEIQEQFILSHNIKSSFVVKKKKLLEGYFPDFDTVCIRIENEKYIYKPASFFWKPLTTTSVNISWKSILSKKSDIIKTFWKYWFIHFVFCDKFLSWNSSEIWDLSMWKIKKIR